MSMSTIDPADLPDDIPDNSSGPTMEHEVLHEVLDEDGNEILKGHDVASLGPSDSSDTGADVVGLGRDDDTSDRNGTGERGSAGNDSTLRDSADIRTDRIVGADEAGLGGGLDQAEEALLGVTDEEIEEEIEDED